MLPKRNRLISKADFEKVRKEGNLVRSNLFFLSFLRNNLPFSRFGVIVSKKVSNRATKRNKIKRVVREAIGNMVPSIGKGFDFVVIAKDAVLGREEKIFGELESLFKSIKDEKNSNTSN